MLFILAPNIPVTHRQFSTSTNNVARKCTICFKTECILSTNACIFHHGFQGGTHLNEQLSDHCIAYYKCWLLWSLKQELKYILIHDWIVLNICELVQLKYQ